MPREAITKLTFGVCAYALGSAAAAATKSLQSCQTLCNPRDGSPPGSPVPGILQARTLEWVAISFSNAWKWKVKVKSLSRVLTPSDAMDCSPPGPSVHGIFHARVLEWGAIAFISFLVFFSYVYVFSCVWLFVTPWSIACQAPLSIAFSMQEHWSGLPFPPLGIFPTQGLNPCLLCLLHCRQMLYCWATREALVLFYVL